MIYRIVMINGHYMDFEADEVYEEEETYKFCEDGDVVAEFNKKNVSGYIELGEEEDEDE